MRIPRLLKTLKFQIGAALTALALLYALSTVHTLRTLAAQHEDDVLLRLATQLQLVARQLAMQAMRYGENVPRDYPSYYRDVKLYYRDLVQQVAHLEDLTASFAEGRFSTATSGMDHMMQPRLTAEARAAAARLAAYWQAFRSRLEERLGPDPAEPRLEWAVEHVGAESQQLNDHVDDLLRALDTTIRQRHLRANRLNQAVLGATTLLALGIFYWFWAAVLRPLGHAVTGFHRVASGDFRHRVPVEADNEIAWLGGAFNRLTGRLDAMVRLLTRLQQGSDLDETLGFVAQTLPDLLPLDWVGILFVSDDGQATLERAFCDGQPEARRLAPFPIADTPLAAALQADLPQHVADLQGLAASSRQFRLLRFLADLGQRDAIFMPVSRRGPHPGLLVFATRRANAYLPEHVELLSNLALLITLSFARTLKLNEQARLAAVGQFASGVAHELRSPLTTVHLALEHLATQDLPGSAARRVDLGQQEARRMARLLDDMLLYAKPLRLRPQPIVVDELLDEVVAELGAQLRQPSLRVERERTSEAVVVADPDRLRQIADNLLRNALDASPQATPVRVAVRPEAAAGSHALAVCNDGEAIPANRLERLFEPFFTTKTHGTGLGLAIVRRLVEAQGGTIEVASSPTGGTCFTVRLPTA